jgi:hypothetical protein
MNMPALSYAAKPIANSPFEDGPVVAGPVFYSERRTIKAAGADKVIAIRLAENADDRGKASVIVNRQYGARGYGNSHRLATQPSSVVFAASTASTVFGTITLTVDSDQGLASDRTFPDEVAALRCKPGSVLTELSKFAFDPSPDSRPFLASLFHIVYLYGTERFHGTDLLIEVNPRHVRFYELMLGFQRVGSLKDNASVGAASQLMHLKVADIGHQIALHAGETEIRSRSLYPYFFNAKVEQKLRERVRSYVAAPFLPMQAANCDRDALSD